ncbi:MAG: hypothetical protein ACJ04Q_11665 [Flavobacteriales bacterium]
MAKSSFNLKGAKRQKLELDVLRLIYTLKYYEELKKESAMCFVLVYNEEIEKTVFGWLKKYKAENLNLEIIVFKNPIQEKIDLINLEKEKNKVGISKSSKEDSSGNFSMNITEKYLANTIQEYYPKVIKIEEKDFFKLKGGEFPSTIRWDYYGVLNN